MITIFYSFLLIYKQFSSSSLIQYFLSRNEERIFFFRSEFLSEEER